MTEQQIILEQYKLYVEMADRISSRRAQTNKFYISILSGILVLLSVAVDKNIAASQFNLVLAAVAALGIGLNGLWYMNIRSYRQLNSGKFQVIHEMEEKLPFACYDREWSLLGGGEDGQTYLQLSRVEQYLPFFLVIPYVLLLIYLLWRN